MNEIMTGEFADLSPEEIKENFLQAFSDGESVTIYWHGSHETDMMNEDGSIEGEVFMGGYKLTTTPQYDCFDDWFEENFMAVHYEIDHVEIGD